MDKINFYNGIENGIINHDNYLMKDILNKYRNIRVLDVDGKFHDAKKIFDKYINKSDTYYINDTTYNPYSSSVNIAQAPSGYFNNLNSLIVNNFFLGYGEMSLLSQNPIISNICNIRADSCISNWIEFVSNQNRTKEIKIIQEWFTEKNIKDIVRNAVKNAFLFGGCQVYIKINNDEQVKDGISNLESPITINKKFDSLLIDKNSIKYLEIIQPLWYFAINWQSFNPLLQDFYKPQKYTILGKTIHASRMLHFKYKEVPDILKPNYMFNGQPLAQELIPYLMGFEQCRIDINKIVAKYNHFVFKGNIESGIDDATTAFKAGQELASRISVFNKIASNCGVLFLDKDTEDFANININANGLTDIMFKNIQYICAIARISINKLFQDSPKGLNATGEFDIKSYHETIKEDRVNMVDKHITSILHLCMLDCFGEILPDITYNWLPLEDINELEQSQTNKNKIDNLLNLLQNNIITKEQVIEILQMDKMSGFNNLSKKEG